VRQFRIGADEFAKLGTGQAIVHTTLGPDPVRADIFRTVLPDRAPARIGNGTKHACEIALHPEDSLKTSDSEGGHPVGDDAKLPDSAHFDLGEG
jgi:hypothetical protein